ncbi:hypothetical protein Ancab_004339 [Ancistrocladus abbreviatus]
MDYEKKVDCLRDPLIVARKWIALRSMLATRLWVHGTTVHMGRAESQKMCQPCLGHNFVVMQVTYMGGIWITCFCPTFAESGSVFSPTVSGGHNVPIKMLRRSSVLEDHGEDDMLLTKTDWKSKFRTDAYIKTFSGSTFHSLENICLLRRWNSGILCSQPPFFFL